MGVGSACKFCGYRCARSNPVPGSSVPYLATCTAGRLADRGSLGYDITAAQKAYPRRAAS